MVTIGDENKELVRRVNDGLNEQSREVFAALHADDVVVHDGSEEIRGIDAALEHESELWTAFPDIHHTLETVLADGDEVAYRFTATGTHEGPFHGVPPTGRAFEITGHGSVRIEDGELAEVWLDYDALGMLRQLGVVDSPSE
ncbi:ester cyclase [Halobium salinum]|uniref:Ester cyclase n=1 Tax=Halobium salinum TaxID=1364940 RepID=A0ABD5PDQ7_9EURY|nr:ester cyclase [Halobium salinum]